MKRAAFFLGLALLCSLAEGKWYRYGTWTFEMPDEAVESRQDGIHGYKAGGISYLFTPPAPTDGRTPEQIAQAVINDVLGNQPRRVELILQKEWNGAQLSVYMVFTQSKEGLLSQQFQIFTRDGQWGLMLTTLPVRADGATEQDMEAAVDVLKSVEFEPPALAGGASSASGDSDDDGLIEASRLPNVPWPAPRADRVILQPAKVNFPAAHKLGLDPETDLLPDTFDCYYTTNNGLRLMNPTPDVRVTFAQNGTYTATDGKITQGGRWQKVKDRDSSYLNMVGPLDDDHIYLYDNDLGQKFVSYWQKWKVVCLQQGPRADELRVTMARGKVGNESFNCLEPNGRTYVLKLSGDTYSTPSGNGRTRSGFKLDDDPDLETVLTFTGGPYDSNDGKISEDDAGNRTLDIQYSVSSGSIFARQTETTLVARCTNKTTPKPYALYGQAKAPATNQKGGPDGFYVGYRKYWTYIGQIPMQSYALRLSYFAPNGYYLDDAEPEETGVLPDCTRTKPNGDPFCERYEIKGKTIRTQGSRGKWSSPDDFAMTPDSVKMDNTTLFRIAPLKAMPKGIFTSDKLNASGMPGNALTGSISNFSNAYQFAQGQFVWRSDSSSSTTVGAIGGNSILASASSSRSDAGSGKYALSGYWLTLTFTDGRIKRLFTYPRPAALAKASKSMTEELNIDGRWLNRAGK